MNENDDKKNISRRKFLKGTGMGLAGSYMIIPAINAPLEKITKEFPVSSDPEGVKEKISLTVNGKKIVKLISPETTLADFLRNDLKLTGTKVVCNHGECGSCTVLLDDTSVYACHMLALDADGRQVTTVEGLMKGEKLHPLQEAFVEHDGLQCGFCTPGQIMAAQALLLQNPHPNREEILDGMSGNLCRCAAYPKILDSVVAAAGKS